MENDGESGDLLFDFVEDVKTDFGIGTGLEFVSTMTGSDCDSEGVNTCLSEECFDFFGFGISFDPRDGTDNGLTVDRAQELGECALSPLSVGTPMKINIKKCGRKFYRQANLWTA